MRRFAAAVNFSSKVTGSARRAVLGKLPAQDSHCRPANLLKINTGELTHRGWREPIFSQSALKKSKLAVLMTAERNNEYGEITRHRLEEFVADNVVILRNVLHREKRRRTIEVLKMRGSHHAEDEAPFTLLENRGVVAVPLSSLRLEQQSSMVRVTSGNPSIDEMCGGGFFRDSVTLVSGATGTGKTLLVTNFLAGGINRWGEIHPVRIWGEQESAVSQRERLGRRLCANGGDGKLKIICFNPEAQGLPDQFLTIQGMVDEFKPAGSWSIVSPRWSGSRPTPDSANS